MHGSSLLRRKLSLAAAAAAVTALALYPVLVYYGLRYVDARWVAAALIAICALRLLGAQTFRRAASLSALPVIASVAGISLAVISLLQDRSEAMLYYPVLVNGALFMLFAHSLVYPPTAIERLARLKDAELPSRAVAYTRRVTVAWTIFFACNGTIALYTAVASSRETWMLYNGFIAYLLIGVMFGGEFLVRSRAMRRSES